MRTLLILVILSVAAPQVQGQGRLFGDVAVEELLPTEGILRNSVSNLHAEGDTLWAGPFLSLTADGGDSWFVPEIDSLLDTQNRVFSLDVEGEVVWSGLGFSFAPEDGGESVQAAAGFVFSVDGGRSFTYRLPQLDDRLDSTVVYGVSTLPALPVIVPQQSPPFDIDFDPGTGDVWVAGWASGIRRSDDDGKTWRRVVLPPDDLDFITPDSLYDFEVAPERGSSGHRNHMGFSVLVDETGTVWAGTAGGLNRSFDGGASWRRFTADGSAQGLIGNWIVSIEEQPLVGRNPIWLAAWDAGGAAERYGISVTRDGGRTFEQHLPGEQVLDFAFRGETVYVAGRERGLWISHDGGRTWRTVQDFYDAERPDQLVRVGTDVQSVATSDDALWVGTSDGLFRSTDGGATWRTFRAEVPLHPATPSEEVPDVDAYAYPNPFSPSGDGVVRIRYEIDSGGGVKVRIFDFGMNLVRLLVDADQAAGAREAVWDGTDDDGVRVANGVYLYAIDSGGETDWGKILVLE